ncbi:MAG: pitrilysin family protein [Planctomycetota bacterium]
MPIEYHERVLPNGLRVAGEVNPDAHSAAAGFFVRTGARDEASGVMGVSHFLEHMMFKGTESISADELNRRFDAMGARNNAYTSNEMTCFYAHVIPERLSESVDLLSRMMRPALRVDDFTTEKGVILEEIAMYKDNPFWVLYEETIARHYGSHRLAHRVLGTDETITDLERDAMMVYFNDRYSADNTVLSVSGRLDFDSVCATAEELCGDWPTTGATRDTARPMTGSGGFSMSKEGVSRVYMLGLAAAPSGQADDRYAAALAAQILGAGDNSRLHWALVETGLAEEAQAAWDGHDGCGDYFVFASCDPDRADQVWDTCMTEAASLTSSIEQDDLEKLRAKLATGATLSGERPGDRMQRLGRQWMTRGSYLTLEDELAMINAVTVDDVKRVLENFPLTPTTWGRLTPDDATG